MRIGFDFDNTIVHYDNLFHKVALEQGVIDASIPVNKLAVRDHLRATNREDIWTEMQGYVYGARMQEADAYPDAILTIKRLKSAGHTLAIMSHKTKQPYMGKQYDLHAAARGWIEKYLVADGEPLIAPENIFFELTKEEKWGRIGKFECEAFIDDLPEILLAPQFPAQVKRYLFDPEQHHHDKEMTDIKIVSTWRAFGTDVIPA
jgi:hypothetical protein